jgi:hypothetical protein
MANAPIAVREDPWDSFEITNQDLEFIYNFLFELEKPQALEELTQALITERIRIEKEQLDQQQSELGTIFYPKDAYKIGQSILFPSQDWHKGLVTSIRNGFNPDLPPFQVIQVKMESGQMKQFASEVANHLLNNPIEIKLEGANLDFNAVLNSYGSSISALLKDALVANPDLVEMAGKWFVRALLVDINVGYLNLAEAVLDMANGGPLPTKTLLEQIDLPSDVNVELKAFSLEVALQQDGRFDDVGSSGEVLWFLHRLEPEEVRQAPLYLRYNAIPFDRSVLDKAMLAMETQLDDEISDIPSSGAPLSEVTICLTYPHWRSGTLPLTQRTRGVFPTAKISPRIQITIVDADTHQPIPAWVVRPLKFVLGLRQWYEEKGLMPGSLLRIKKTNKAGEVAIQVEKRRSSREWLRTVLVGADGGVVIATLKQVISANYDERMAIMIPNVESLDQVWEQNLKQHQPIDQVILKVMKELSKLNMQGHVHAQELYAAVNVIRRCPPGIIFNIIANSPIYNHVGDLHFRIVQQEEE